MTFITPQDIRSALILGHEIALIDVREEADFARGHPLFAAQIPVRRIAIEAYGRIPRRDVLLVVYDQGEGLAATAAAQFEDVGYEHVRELKGGLEAWRDAGYELFEDVNSYSKAFGELVEHRRHTPSLTSPEVKALIDGRANVVVLDARRFDEYNTMSIPSGISVPGAELVLSAAALAPDPDTTIIVNCAGRTRSIIGTQSLINAGLPNKVVALRNGTIGWTLAGQVLDTGQTRRGFEADRSADAEAEARNRARNVAYRAGVRRITHGDLVVLEQDVTRTLYRFDVRQKAAFEAGHIQGFAHVPGGQLVQETDHYAPVRGARIVLSDDIGPRADMSASWLAQMGWEVYVLDGGGEGAPVTGPDAAPPARGPEGRYKRPYEGTENQAEAMEAYLQWEYGLVDQLARDATHGFYVI